MLEINKKATRKLKSHQHVSTNNLTIVSKNDCKSNQPTKELNVVNFIKQKKKFILENSFDIKGTRKFLASKEVAMRVIKLNDEIIEEDKKIEDDFGVPGIYDTNVGDDYANQDVVSLFLWGANGENGIAPYNTSNIYWEGNVLGSNDWAIKANAANLDGHDDWFILSKEEWNYLINNHTHDWSTVAGQEGYVFRPDGNNTAVASSYTKETWADEEAAGSVFLPAVGTRLLRDVNSTGEFGCYWTSTSGEDI